MPGQVDPPLGVAMKSALTLKLLGMPITGEGVVVAVTLPVKGMPAI